MKSTGLARLISLAVVVLMVLITSGCQYILPKEEEPLPPPLVEPKDVVYTTVDVTRGDIENTVQGVGRVQSVKMDDLFFEAGGGRLKSINVKYGDMVKPGDVLLQLDTGDLDYQITVSNLKIQQWKNAYAQNKKHMSKTDKDNAAIDLQIMQLDLQQLLKKKSDATLTAPIAGQVVYITTVNQGSLVDAYTTLVRIADQSVKMLEYETDSNQSSFQIGMKVKVTLNSDGSTADGEVVSTPFERDKFDDQKLANMLFIKVPDAFLAKSTVGDEAKIVLTLAERKNVLKLPRNAVKTYLQRRYVQLLVNNVKVEKDVQVGLETVTETEILSGLSEGDKVILR